MRLKNTAKDRDALINLRVDQIGKAIGIAIGALELQLGGRIGQPEKLTVARQVVGRFGGKLRLGGLGGRHGKAGRQIALARNADKAHVARGRMRADRNGAGRFGFHLLYLTGGCWCAWC